LRRWGVTPIAIIGHSLGEYVAAALAGAVSDVDALRLLVERATAAESLASGAMLGGESIADLDRSYLDQPLLRDDSRALVGR
jgi:acyl transferase domain-containing protein